MNCPKCSSALPDDSEFCSFCGEKIINAVANEEIIKQSNKRTPKAKKVAQNNSNSTVKILACFVILLIVSTIAFASLYISSENKYKKTVEEYEEKINEKSSRIFSLVSEVDSLKAKLRIYDYLGYKEKAEFLDERIAFVTENSNYYHTYDCDDFKGSFWAYNTEAAKGNGYKPCPRCH